MTELIICEKPAQAQRIAQALSDKKLVEHKNKQVKYYELTHKGKKILVGCAVGHLFTIGEKTKKKSYPNFDVEWQPNYLKSKSSAFTKIYLDTLKSLSKKADKFIVACDYDLEGSVIGHNVVKYIAGKKDAKRMKFSTLTKDELIESYEKASKHLDFPQIEAGETRHILDFIHGVNTSRALTNSIKKASNGFKLMSTGRVQGPTLKLIVDRELEIKKFIPVPYWELELTTEKDKKIIKALHEEEKFTNEEKAIKIFKKCKNKKATIKKLKTSKQNILPPAPFDLTTLQTEAFTTLRIKPKDTLAIAQSLYLAGLISYPRTSSQQLPESLNYKKIITSLSKQPIYTKYCSNLLKSNLKPNNGKKIDKAHPAIHPTGEIKHLQDREAKLYDLIVRRTLATFSEKSLRETIEVTIVVNKENFITKGTITIKPGWQEIYKPYLRIKEIEFPSIKEKEELKVKKLELLSKETQPPKRFTQASIIKKMETLGLGTKCLTEKTKIRVSSEKPQDIEISELFKEGKKIDTKIGNSYISVNNKHECYSFNKGAKSKSKYKFVSKRNREKTESIYKITFSDGSNIELTGEHPLLTYKGKNFIYKRARKLDKKDRAVASFWHYDKYNGDLIEWSQFMSKISLNNNIFGVINIKNIRSKLNISQIELGKLIGCNQSSISVYEKKSLLPLTACNKLKVIPKLLTDKLHNLTIENPLPFKISSPLARILANLIGDGSIDKEKIKKENCFDFRYHNTNIDLINRFIEDIYNIFGVKLKCKLGKEKTQKRKKIYYVKVPSLLGRILYTLSNEILNKNVSKLINKEFYPEFVAALFDDEGHVYKNETKIFISNTNINLLKDIKKMLNEIEINSTISAKQYKLYIRKREDIIKFLDKIPFIHKDKKERFLRLLTEHYKYTNKKSIIEIEKNILKTISSNEKTTNEIANELGLRNGQVYSYLTKLIRLGYVSKKIKGISEQPKKKILYKNNLDLSNTFYSIIGEKIINSNFATKAIESIEKVDYSGHLYDITNTKQLPNFITSNNIVLHNSTRSAIVETLYDRGYIIETSLEATNLGIKTIETLKKYSPEIIDVKLTRHFEKEMEEIQEGKRKESQVIKEAERELTKIFDKFKKNEMQIGKELSEANIKSREEASLVGICNKCEKGKLQIRRGKYGLFIACNNYPDCKNLFNVPSNALVTPTNKNCESCNFPQVKIIKSRQRPREYCINPKCKTREVTEEKVPSLSKEKMKCPKCGKLFALKQSFYGKFYGCSGYPKCKTMMKLDGTIVEYKSKFSKKKRKTK